MAVCFPSHFIKEEQHCAISSDAASTISSSIEEVDDGWTTIQVFSGFNASRSNDDRWNSQARQDELVLALLRNKTGGYFVDLAANDAVLLSNTYSLERDWEWKRILYRAQSNLLAQSQRVPLVHENRGRRGKQVNGRSPVVRRADRNGH
jgi:hypothetical protein